ncbi:MAG: hypothetical protein M1817_002047 [Caeruleum heppii]|nr:MAG: hypothetical protein M1817_002047 [Caeruleum heppii]
MGPRSASPISTPTTDVVSPPSKSFPHLAPRQTTIVAIPNTYGNLNDSQPPGTVAGIVLGSVAGFLFILWLLYLIFNSSGGGASVVAEEEIVVRDGRRGSRSSRSRRAETIEVHSTARLSSSSSSSSSDRTRSRSRPRRSPMRETRTERIIVEERRAPVAAPRGEDIVEVIEEHGPPRRSRSGRDRDRPVSGYRAVDPDAYAGGNRAVHEVFTGGRGSRRSGGRR